jgi:4-diphosphocytidyl-2-C-methyl-D-erythritol kinase
VSTERAPAKLNLVLQVGERRADGLHELCSLFAALELADELTVEAGGEGDVVCCPGVQAENLAARALAAYRRAAPADAGPPPIALTIAKRIPVAAGLGGGSADAAAALRAADALTARPLGPQRLREIGAALGSDVPSQVEPRHALVTGAGEGVEPVALTRLDLVLVPGAAGLSAGDVYAEHDRHAGAGRGGFDADAMRELAGATPAELAARLENDLQPAVLSLRPEVEPALDDLVGAGALAALVTGSGPTAFGLFDDVATADAAARSIAGAIRTRTAGTER